MQLIKSPRLTEQQMTTICDQLIDGKSLATICKTNDSVPGKKTVFRHIQQNDDAYIEYQRARALQAEILREDIIEIVTAPLPNDPKLAMANVQRRRLKCDHKDKYVRQLAPSGLRDRVEDHQQKDVTGGKITISWES